MDRRNFLYLLGGGALGGGGIIASQNEWNVDKSIESISKSTGDLLGKSDRENSELVQDFGFLSPGFDKIEFKRVIASNFNGWLAEITFGTHSMDGFGIRHSSLDSIEDDIYVCKAPKSTGTRRVPIVRILKNEDAVYPNRNFKLVAYEGQFSECGASFQLNISRETKGTAEFTLPKKIAPESSFREL